MASMFRKPGEPTSEGDSRGTSAGELHGEAHPTTNGGGNDDKKRSAHTRTISPRINLGSTGRILSFKSLSSHKLESLFHLSLVENQCRTTALDTLNELREPTDHLAEDHPEVKSLTAELFVPHAKAWCLKHGVSLELIGEVTAATRNQMSSAFQEYLRNQARTKIRQLQSPTGSVTEITEIVGFVPFRQSSPLSFVDGASSLVSGSSRGPFKLNSPYKREYEELAILGKGGYGQVFRVRSHLDKQEYAVKKVLIKSQRVKKSLKLDQIDALLAEVQTLAKLNHINIVRYHHAWIEDDEVPITDDRKSGDNISNQRLLKEPDSPDSVTGSHIDDEEDSTTTELESDQAGVQRLPHSFGTNFTEETNDDGVIFEFSSAHSQGPFHDAAPLRHDKNPDMLSSVTFQTTKLSVAEEEDDADVENIPRAAEEIGKSATRADPFLLDDGTLEPAHSEYGGSDIMLCIKMSLYPITLATFLSGEHPKGNDVTDIRHCFHQGTSVEILAAILHGLDYLHGQKIVHRDIKPANIFLSIHEDKPLAIDGCVDITACTGCSHLDTVKRIYITPCIGDFGLIAEQKEPLKRTDSDPDISLFEPSRLSALHQKPVGTFYYRPISMPIEEPIICPKLDVYSLGVIALELIYKFGTKSERATVLSNLKQGVLPAEMESHVMANGIKSMVCEGRRARWGCDDVRNWLERMRGKGKAVD